MLLKFFKIQHLELHQSLWKEGYQNVRNNSEINQMKPRYKEFPAIYQDTG